MLESLSRKSKVILSMGLFIFSTTCGVNIYKQMPGKKNQAYYYEQAIQHLDNKEYSQALESLENMDDNDTTKIFLKASAELGKVGLGLWDIVKNIIDNTTLESQGSGIDKVLNLISDSFFSVGEERELRIATLSSVISRLSTTDATQVTDKKRMDNFRCFLSGILVIPAITDGSASLLSTIEALNTLEETVVGDGADLSQCPAIDGLNTSLTTLDTVQKSLDLAISQIVSCEIFTGFTSSSQANLNNILKKLRNFLDKADGGCVPADCPADNPICGILNLGCVQKKLGGTAKAADGQVEVCEIIQNCHGAVSCF